MGTQSNLNKWAPGYSQSDLDRAQERFALTFPPDLLALLRERRPKDGPDWNNEAAIRSSLAWPYEGLLFDVEHSALWWPEWGERPAAPAARAEVLRDVVSHAPKLIPLFSHRYLPQAPAESGNPVFSVYQSDVVYYGSDLEDYFIREFDDLEAPFRGPFKWIEFWSDFAEGRHQHITV
jgi:hypothetical protein